MWPPPQITYPDVAGYTREERENMMLPLDLGLIDNYSDSYTQMQAIAILSGIMKISVTAMKGGALTTV